MKSHYIIGSLLCMLGLGLSCSIFTLDAGSALFIEIEVMPLSSLSCSFLLLFDMYSILFGLIIIKISIAVLFFSANYMQTDIFSGRFYPILFIFVLSMLLMVFSPNLLSILLGWDGLGISSFLLVAFYNNSKAINASMLTALSNRVGDGLMMSAAGLAVSCGSLTLFNLDTLFLNSKFSTAMTGLVIAGAMTKSAQVPLIAWLPAAMAAPTPVSSLVHSSTLVTAGVYLILRHSHVVMTSRLNIFLLVIGGATLVTASLGAMTESDFKKVIALSTLSQLGLLFMSLSVGAPSMTLLHLLAHAFFKALLFICIGVVIHTSSGFQDTRMVNFSAESSPVVTSFVILSLLSLAGLPFMSAFYSKELILEVMMMSNSPSIGIIFMWGSIWFTAAYSSRILLLVSQSSSGETLYTPGDSLGTTSISLGLLGWGAVIAGAVLVNLMYLNETFIYLSNKMSVIAILMILWGASSSSKSSFWGTLAQLLFLSSRSVNYIFINESAQNLRELTDNSCVAMALKKNFLRVAGKVMSLGSWSSGNNLFGMLGYLGAMGSIYFIFSG